MALPNVENDCLCTNETVCRIQGCETVVKFGPCGTINPDDPTDVDWTAFQTPVDITNLSLDESVDIDTFKVLGSCFEQTRVGTKTFSLSMDLYWCATDPVQCELTAGCEIQFAIFPCGDDPTLPVIYGSAVVGSYSYSFSPDDYISASVSLTGNGELYKANICDVEAAEAAPLVVNKTDNNNKK